MIDESTTQAHTSTLDVETEPVAAWLQEDGARDKATAQALRDYLAARALAEPA